LPDDLDWAGLADPKTTLIVYMGGRTAAKLAHSLIDQGLAPTTPVVAVSGVSRPEETRWTGTLASLADGALTTGSQPVVIGVGQTFADVVLASHTVPSEQTTVSSQAS
jgi:uroporphyrin-III C-methyltransferase / precorrin-2 dehydrogenase / sirohydrochlorin ferrochelatase